MQVVLGVVALVAPAVWGQGCSQTERCTQTSRCDGFAEQKAAWQQIGKTYEKSSQDYKNALDSLKERICGRKRDRTVCCCTGASCSPSFLPTEGECGNTGDAKFIVGGKVNLRNSHGHMAYGEGSPGRQLTISLAPFLKTLEARCGLT